MKPVGKPYAGKPHVRFDEGDRGNAIGGEPVSTLSPPAVKKTQEARSAAGKGSVPQRFKQKTQRFEQSHRMNK